jgi:hypothetical protein
MVVVTAAVMEVAIAARISVAAAIMADISVSGISAADISAADLTLVLSPSPVARAAR